VWATLFGTGLVDLVDIECEHRYPVQDVAWRDLAAEQVGQLTDDHEDGFVGVMRTQLW
jgi:hypothetical protein